MSIFDYKQTYKMSSVEKSGFFEGSMKGTHEITIGEGPALTNYLKGTSQAGKMGAFLMTEAGGLKLAVKDVVVKFSADTAGEDANSLTATTMASVTTTSITSALAMAAAIMIVTF